MHRNTLTLAFIATLAILLFAGGASAAGDAAKGKATFQTLCVSCHGETGKGDGPVGAVLQPPPQLLGMFSQS